jgi:hypothetical protein
MSCPAKEHVPFLATAISTSRMCSMNAAMFVCARPVLGYLQVT